ncbi:MULTISPECIES: flavodoxin family protein [Streptomyces]|uniref:flavodoxin family protein n=1 Tax=Streptomyces TaxID=1883 RepID=UPI0004C7C943|nr:MULTISPECIES: NAD(P)H-dependent oxidoreductase [Streptomyces]NDZ64585.1 NAD(P)H-dependent oxidoreductase [Streptomyces cyaneofuscatus]ONI49204.1 NADPH-dependent FMN reductase [Streptomyces sp. IB2014 011-1]RDV47679.1 NADPH-dependent oxidoreductase [Streptomyces sp. IB2014 011-12]CAD5922223.1 NADPH-dependent FMN reductase [Streptomyces sp. KY75]CAD5990946.1 NADPH-dependent FMN reductase [Streptomyces sp. KY70]
MRALALVCTLNPSPARSSSQHLAEQVMSEFDRHGVQGEIVRIADHDVRPGVEVDMGDGDAWPAIREKMLAADILLIATPIWLGHPSSLCQRVLERLDGELSETDDQGRPLVYGKVAAVAVVGNEDGAHKVSADLFQGLDDVGFSLAPGAVTYWVGEAMQGTDYQDLDETPETVASTTRALAANAVHLARLLADAPYPASS